MKFKSCNEAASTDWSDRVRFARGTARSSMFHTRAPATRDINNTCENYCQYQYQYFCDNTFYCLLHSAMFIFPHSSINKVNGMIIVEKMAKSL